MIFWNGGLLFIAVSSGKVNMKKILQRPHMNVFFTIVVLTLDILSACGGGPSSPNPVSQIERPDLTFTGHYNFQFENTLSPTGNDLYTLVVEVSNPGDAPVELVQVVAHSKGPGIEGDPPPLENNGYYSLTAGETIEVRFQFIFERNFWGEYEFTITIDPSNTVPEVNEFNNQLVFRQKF
jgi:hypothetical protein